MSRSRRSSLRRSRPLRRQGTEAPSTRCSRGTPPTHLDAEFAHLEVADLGGGAIVAEVVQTYRLRSTGEVAYTRPTPNRSDGSGRQIARYENAPRRTGVTEDYVTGSPIVRTRWARCSPRPATNSTAGILLASQIAASGLVG
jgi:hypothetical protein